MAALVARPVLDPRLGERDHRGPLLEAGHRLVARQYVDAATDQVVAALHGNWVRARRLPHGLVARRSAGMHGHQVVAGDHELLHGARRAVVVTGDLHVFEMQLLAGVEQVGQPIRLEANPAVDPMLRAIRHEADERCLRQEVRLVHLLECRLQDKVQAAW